MNSDRNKKVAVVTGASSGIGLETSLLLARNGFYTYVTMRNLDKSKAITNIKQKEKLSLEVLKLDVTTDESANEAIQKITHDQGRIDVLVNNAGYALVGPFEELDIEEFKEQFETNVFGVIRVTQAVLPIMRRQRYGTKDRKKSQYCSYFVICRNDTKEDFRVSLDLKGVRLQLK